jgi:hypothetical protein
LKWVAGIAVAATAALVAAIAAIALPRLSEPRPELGFFDGKASLILDRRGDAWPDQQYQTGIAPEVRGYHDIVAAGVKKAGDAFLLTILLAGDPNTNEKYETNYAWHIITPSHAYTVLLPNFA